MTAKEKLWNFALAVASFPYYMLLTALFFIVEIFHGGDVAVSKEKWKEVGE